MAEPIPDEAISAGLDAWRAACLANASDLTGIRLVLEAAAPILRAAWAATTVPPGPCPSVRPNLLTFPEVVPCALLAGHAGDHIGDGSRWGAQITQDAPGEASESDSPHRRRDVLVQLDRLMCDVHAMYAEWREQAAQAVEAYAENYPPDVWPEDSPSPDAIGARAMRHAYRNAARIVRDTQFPAHDHDDVDWKARPDEPA